MPQFDPAVWPTQLFWLAVIFVVLYLLMSRVALPRVAEVLEEREVRISDRLRKAETLKHDAEDAIAAYETSMAAARTQAHEQLRQAHEAAAAEAAARQAELAATLSSDLEAAEARIGAARDQAIAGLRDMAGELVGSVVERLTGEKPDAGAVKAAVAKVMKEAA
jgi:F-type H+-transporting ATPase subunit b